MLTLLLLFFDSFRDFDATVMHSARHCVRAASVAAVAAAASAARRQLGPCLSVSRAVLR